MTVGELATPGYRLRRRQSGPVRQERGILMRFMQISLVGVLILSLSACFSKTGQVNSDNTVTGKNLDLVYFMTGMAWHRPNCQTDTNDVVPSPLCETFFRQGDERDLAELYLDAASRYKTQTLIASPVKYHWTSNGDRLEIENIEISKLLDAAYLATQSKQQILALAPREQLSWVAGFYARNCRRCKFNCDLGFWGEAVMEIVNSHGCVVKNLVIDSNGVPSTMHFDVVPSPEIQRLWELVDNWQAPKVDWGCPNTVPENIDTNAPNSQH